MAAHKKPGPGSFFEAALYAKDLDAAEQFYHGLLGLEVLSRMDGRRGIAFRCGEIVLLVFDPDQTQTDEMGISAHGAIGAGHIAFAPNESEFGDWREYLSRQGVAIEAEVEWPTGGRSIYFRDPAGNLVELAPPTLWGMKKTD